MSERFESGYLNPASNFDNSSLGVLTFRSESHVAQQRRRDKLRVPPQTHNIDDVPTHLLHVHGQSGLNPNLVQVCSNTNCDLLQDLPPLFSSEMLNFSMNNHVWLGHKDAVLQQEASGGAQSGRSIGLDDVSCSNSSKLAGPQNPCHWKGIGSQQNFDWNVNYANTSGGDVYSQNPLIVGETLPSKLKLNDTSLSASSMYMNPGGYQDVQSSLTNSANAMSSQECSKHYGEINFSSPSFYPNALQEIVSSSAVVAQGHAMASIVQQNNRESSQCAWVERGNDQVLPTNASHFGGSRLNDTDSWMHRPVDGTINQWNGELGLAGRSRRYLDRVTGESTSRGLSLSLSSHSPSNVAQVDERIGFKNLQSRAGICGASQDSKSIDPGYLCSGSKSSVPNNFHGIVGSSANHRRSIGPLGPFTGYSTILKNSKFLKPAQHLLDEICIVTGSKILKARAMPDRGSREVSTSSYPIDGDGDGDGDEVNCRAGSSDVSSFNSSNGAGTEGRMGSRSCQTYNPEYHEKKAKLLYMQEEVCRRYKQYHQQMQMVVASFESVAGLSSATPYTSLALKAVSKHFNCLKNAISDQIKCITKALGEEFLSSPIGTSKSDSIIPKLRSTDPNLRKQQVGGDRLSIVEAQVPQQPIWRPQRGLPERAVSVLRAWLFDHFLHPYPSDTDKHMLAAQTGLSRNQVSNWFINARVRVWKPMVEEMHALETKGSTDPDQNSNNPKPDNTGNAGCSGEQSSNELMIDAMSEKLPECSPVQHVPNDIRPQDKRSRMEHQFPTSVDCGLMGFVPYHHTGLGAVSLTLGLRHTADHHHQQQQDQHRRHYGDQMIHDFVG